MGICQYRYNPTEQYQRTPPGSGVESCCGAPTYPARDVPEVIAVRRTDGEAAWVEMVPTGQLVDRDQHDPHCPAHGGTPAPERKAVTLTEIQQARQNLVELAAGYDGDPALALNPAAPGDRQAIGVGSNA